MAQHVNYQETAEYKRLIEAHEKGGVAASQPIITELCNVAVKTGRVFETWMVLLQFALDVGESFVVGFDKPASR